MAVTPGAVRASDSALKVAPSCCALSGFSTLPLLYVVCACEGGGSVIFFGLCSNSSLVLATLMCDTTCRCIKARCTSRCACYVPG